MSTDVKNGLVVRGGSNFFGEVIVFDDLSISGGLDVAGLFTVGGLTSSYYITQSRTGYAGLILDSQSSGDPFFTLQLDAVDKAALFYSRGSDRLVFSVGGDRLYLYPSGVLTALGLIDASAAGIRTKHESGATPTGGNSGEVRVGTDKVWVQDAGTWKSAAVSAAGAPSFATLAKLGTD